MNYNHMLAHLQVTCHLQVAVARDNMTCHLQVAVARDNMTCHLQVAVARGWHKSTGHLPAVI